MATIRRRGQGWHVQIRIAGTKPVTRTFATKDDAVKWSRQIEGDIQDGAVVTGLDILKRTTLRQLIERYRDTVTIHKKSAVNETMYLDAILREPFVDKLVAAVTRDDLVQYRDERLKSVKASTINHDLTFISQVFNTAKHEWGIPVENPMFGIRRPKADQARTRRLEKDEFDALLRALDVCRNPHIKPLVLFAIETAMRRGEMLALTWANINVENRTLHIPVAKNGHARTIPLTTGAMAILEGQRRKRLDQPFPITAEAVKLAWQRTVKRAKLTDLHFHDLRHEAVSRFFELGLTMAEVALISGHRDPRMLFRYTHLKAEDVGRKLSSALATAADSDRLTNHSH